MSHRPAIGTETDDPETDRHAAGIRRRTAAYVLDLAVVGGVVATVATRLGRTRSGETVLAASLALLGGTLYHVVLEGATGRTAGKALAGLAVVRRDGGPCGYRAAAIRTALRVVDWLPAGYVIGLLAIRLTEQRQRVGDIVADTKVVRTRDARRR